MKLMGRTAVQLSLRVLMEAGIVAGLAYWGYHTASGTSMQIALALLAPVIGFGLWGTVDFRGAGGLAEPLRLSEELVISGLAAFAVYSAGQRTAGVALAAVSVVYHVLVYATGGRLLAPRPGSGRRRAPTDVHHAGGLTVAVDGAGAVLGVICSGRINSSSRPVLEAAVRECLAHEPEAIRFDLRDAWIDSSGAGHVLALYDECLRAGVRVEALTAPATREIFSRLGLPLRFRLEKGGQMVRVIPTVPTDEWHPAGGLRAPR
jgi:anti-anti-sigma regulatory factor